MARGEGAFGRLMVEDALIRELETLTAGLNKTVGGVGPVLEELQVTVGNIAVMSEALREQSESIPDASRRLGSVLDSVDPIMADLRRTTPELPRISRSMAPPRACPCCSSRPRRPSPSWSSSFDSCGRAGSSVAAPSRRLSRRRASRPWR